MSSSGDLAAAFVAVTVVGGGVGVIISILLITTIITRIKPKPSLSVTAS